MRKGGIIISICNRCVCYPVCDERLAVGTPVGNASCMYFNSKFVDKGVMRQSGDWIEITSEYNKAYRKIVLTSFVPDDGEEVFLSDGESVWTGVFNEVTMGFYEVGCEVWDNKPTHWMKFPKPPERKK